MARPSSKFKKTPISKNDVLRAMRATRSNKAAAHFLGCSYQYFRQFAKMYVDKESGRTLFDIHLNRFAAGIPKIRAKKSFSIQDILNGTESPHHHSPDVIKRKMITEGYLEEKCVHCGFNEHRVTDYKVPLLVFFKDKDKLNWSPLNIELYCYNCYFLTIGEVFNKKQFKSLQDSHPTGTIPVDWEIDDFKTKKINELANWSDDEDKSGEEFISRI